MTSTWHILCYLSKMSILLLVMFINYCVCKEEIVYCHKTYFMWN